MNERDFVYWLQGFAELNGAPPSEQQWAAIQQHLGLVLTKVTPAVPKIGVPVASPALGPILDPKLALQC